MNKTVLKVLIIVSIIIMVLGVFASYSIKQELNADNESTQNIYIDGTDITPFVDALREIGSGILGIVIIIYAILAIACIWGVYGLIFLILVIIKKIKCKRCNYINQQ